MKKIISLALVMVLVLSLAAMPVAAAGITESVSEGNRFYAALQYVEENGIFLAEDAGETNMNAWLEGDATRIEYATWLARFAGAELDLTAELTGITDMDELKGTEGYAAVVWGVENGYIFGYKDNTFRPERPISREEMCALIARYFRSNNWAGLTATENITLFIDQDEFSEYTIEQQNVVDCVKYGLITGRESGRFDAKHWEEGETVYTSRQQVAAIFYRAAGNPLDTTKLYAELVVDGGKFTARMNQHATLVLTFPKGTISAENLTAKLTVGPMAFVGMESRHTFSRTINTGITETVDLSNFLSNCFDFEDATVTVNVNDITFVYQIWGSEIDANGNTTVVFIAEDACPAREAVNALMDTVSVGSNDNGSFATLTGESYLQVGERYAALVNMNDWTITEFRDAQALLDQFNEKVELGSDSDTRIELFLEKGITGGYGQKSLTLNNNIGVLVEGVYGYDLGEALYALTEEGADITVCGLDLIEAINALFGEMSGNNDIVINITID